MSPPPRAAQGVPRGRTRTAYHLIPYRGLLWEAYDALELSEGMCVLDAGCGAGDFEHFVNSKCPPPITLEAIDGSSRAIHAARTRCRGIEYASFSAADLNGPLPFGDATFDRVVSLNALPAGCDRDAVLRELLRVLKPGGRIVISSPLPSYSTAAIIADHFRRIGNIRGVHRRLARVISTCWVLSTSGVADWVLGRVQGRTREAASPPEPLDGPEFETLLRARSGEGVSDVAVRLASAGQRVFATAVKRVIRAVGKRDLEFIVCETAEEIAAAQRLRYEVYCLEKGWVDQGVCIEGLETDAFDDGAIHFLALEAGVPVGTARYLLGHVCELPAATYLSLDRLGVKPHEVVEVSRLATRKHGRSQDLQVFVGLTLLMWEWAMERSVRVWLAVADVPLYHLLVRIGLPVIDQAEEAEYLGSACVPVAFDMPGTGQVLRRRSR